MLQITREFATESLPVPSDVITCILLAGLWPFQLGSFGHEKHGFSHRNPAGRKIHDLFKLPPKLGSSNTLSDISNGR